MTESEAIKACNTIVFAALSGDPMGVPLNMTKDELAEAMGTAVKALADVQQYRDTTLSPEQVRTLQTRFVEVSIRLGEYMAIGTPEECRSAVEKQISRHPVDKTKPDSGYGNYYENARVIVCPNCNGRLKLKSKGKYCDKCGQKLSWEDA